MAPGCCFRQQWTAGTGFTDARTEILRLKAQLKRTGGRAGYSEKRQRGTLQGSPTEARFINDHREIWSITVTMCRVPRLPVPDFMSGSITPYLLEQCAITSDR